MTTPDDPGQLLTLTEAASFSGYSREALRLRVRRKKLPAVRGNDGMVRVKASDLADLPPSTPDDPEDDHPVHDGDELAEARLQLAILQVDRDAEKRRADAAQTRVITLEEEVRDARALVDQRTQEVAQGQKAVGRAEALGEAARAAQAMAEAAAARAEGKVSILENELREARRPLWERVVRSLRG